MGVQDVAIFWDYENCPAPSSLSGCQVVKRLRSLVQPFGFIKVFKAYFSIAEQSHIASRNSTMRSELQASGVSLIDTPHNNRKDVADKMIMVDMLCHAIDHAAPATIILVSGDRDFAYAVSVLRLRGYEVVLIGLSHSHGSLTAQASHVFDWGNDVVDAVTMTDHPVPADNADSSFKFPSLNLVSSAQGAFDATMGGSLGTLQLGIAQGRLGQTGNGFSSRTLPSSRLGIGIELGPSAPPIELFTNLAPKIELLGGGSGTLSTQSSPASSLNTSATSPHTPLKPLDSSQTSSFVLPLTGTNPDQRSDMSSSATSSYASAIEEHSPVVPPPQFEVSPYFKPLIRVLQSFRARGVPRPLCSAVSNALDNVEERIYEVNPRVKTFKDYIGPAKQAGIVDVGGRGDEEWIALTSGYVGYNLKS